MSENTNAGVRDTINFVAIGIPSELKISNPSTPHYRSGFCNLLVLGALGFIIASEAMQDSSSPTPGVYHDDYSDDPNDDVNAALPSIAAGVFGVVYLFYLIESCCSDSRKYMSNFKDVAGAEAFLSQMVDTPPDVAMTCECYHYETRYRTVTSTDSNGRTTTRTESYTVKVTTYRETDYFRYRAWKDESGPFHGMTLHAIVKLRLYKLVVWNDDASHRAFVMAYSAFQARNRWRDSHFSHNWDMRIRGFRTNVLALSDPTAKPCWLSFGCFWLSTLLLCSWPWRRMLTSSSVEAKFTLRKVILA
ncbi:hypothetical protein FNF29_07510 [Cafeteria roenbergensis]|uniref:Uncharacterized protein n=1 Tax=Cafeteria roenbergensis TaxID=33653 RepID=A0A5A8C3Z1_CAFRO|nr:hypothetical protein FNF29_07510 [Cafeteria roenbergensis]|eukprot:KAA0147249.1 hypothetical protein FNF29_07510 [Cafeteria roenbergensis]